MRASLLLAAAAVALAAPACSDETSCTDCATSTATSTGGGGSSGAGGSGGIDTRCGGPEGRACGPHDYCDYPGDPCAPEAIGACVPRPMQCDDPITPVCGCEGKSFITACEAHQAGFDVVADATCGLPPGVFQCGDGLCRPNEYCEEVIPGNPDLDPFYACRLLPAACGEVASCICLKVVPCGDQCGPSADGVGLQVTCGGP